MAVMAAVDLGAQSGRVAVGRLDGERLTVSEAHRFDNVPVRIDDRLCWDIRRLYADVFDGLRGVAREATVDSVAVDSWAIDFGLLDRSGELVRNPVHYRDPRRAAAVAGVFERIPPRELYERTGVQMLPINTIFELAAMADDHDPALDRADALLLVPDLFHHRLCGSRTTEFTNATTTQCFDPRAGDWASDLLERLEVPVRVLPEVVAPGTQLGLLSAEAAEDTGLVGTVVVAVATHDTGSAVAGVPFTGAGGVFLSVGTWSLVGVETDGPLIDHSTFAANLSNEGGVEGTFRVLRNVTGLWILEECRRNWAADGTEHSLSELVALAREAPAFVSLIEPNDPRFAAPGDMPERVAGYCTRTGQPEPSDPGALVRCVLESLALKHAQTVDLLASATGREVTVLHVVGGGARNELLCEWTAHAAGLPVLAGPDEATLYGNLLVQAIALGKLSSLAEARELLRCSYRPRAYEPDGSQAWREARERFDLLTAAVDELEVSA
jgi:rhamnulokinase